MYFKRPVTKKSTFDPWYSRGYLPHFDRPDKIQSLTFHLHDAMPVKVVQQWKSELELAPDTPHNDPRHIELRRRISIYADRGYGKCWLRNPDAATIFQNALLYFDNNRYNLLAWCIMPNHVHTVIDPIAGNELDTIVHSWKSFTAKEINRKLSRSGVLWERDYYDRFVRNEKHFGDVVAYIENNPVNAGLVSAPEDWKFSSARFKSQDPL